MAAETVRAAASATAAVPLLLMLPLPLPLLLLPLLLQLLLLLSALLLLSYWPHMLILTDAKSGRRGSCFTGCMQDTEVLAQWTTGSPVGVDLEYCMRSATGLRDRLLSLPGRALSVLLWDDRTMVASEDTCLALVLAKYAAAPWNQGGRLNDHEWTQLLGAVRWPWLSSSLISYVLDPTVLPPHFVAGFQKAAVFLPSLRGKLLRQWQELGPCLRSSAAKGCRPRSSVTELRFEWEHRHPAAVIWHRRRHHPCAGDARVWRPLLGGAAGVEAGEQR
jgi:hypothetical protein